MLTHLTLTTPPLLSLPVFSGFPVYSMLGDIFIFNIMYVGYFTTPSLTVCRHDNINSIANPIIIYLFPHGIPNYSFLSPHDAGLLTLPVRIGKFNIKIKYRA